MKRVHDVIRNANLGSILVDMKMKEDVLKSIIEISPNFDDKICSSDEVSNPPISISADYTNALKNIISTATDKRKQDHIQRQDIRLHSNYFDNHVDQLRMKYETEIKRLKLEIQNQKEDLRNLQISQTTYEELKRIPEEELSIRDFVAVRVEEMIGVYRLDAQQANLSLMNTQAAMNETSHLVQLQQAELERLRRHSDVLQESHRRDSATLEEELRRVSAILEKETTVRQTYEEKAQQFDTVSSDLRHNRKECEALREVTERQSQMLSSLQAAEAEKSQQAADLTRMLEMRKQDIAYLQVELREARSVADNRSRALEQSQGKVTALENKVAELADRLLSEQLAARTELERKLEREVTRIREESRLWTEESKQSARDLSEREVRVLREVSASLEAELDSQRKRCDKLSSDIADLQTRTHHQLLEREGTIGDLRAEVKLKLVEITNLGLALEDKASALRRLSLELEQLREEHSAYRKAFTKLEEDSIREKTQLQAELDSVKLTLRTMEHQRTAVEQELALHLARDRERAETISLSSGEDDATADSLKEELLKLKKQFLQKDVELSAARNELMDVRDLLAAGTDRGSADSARVYLATKLREAERSFAQAQGRAEGAEARQARLQVELERTLEALAEETAAAAEARKRLEQLLQRRHEVEELRGILEAFMLTEAEEQEEADGIDYAPSSNSRRGDGGGVERLSRNLEIALQQAMNDDDDDEEADGGAVGDSGAQEKVSIGPTGGDDGDSGTSNPSSPPPLSLEERAAALGITPEQLRKMLDPPAGDSGVASLLAQGIKYRRQQSSGQRPDG